MFTPVRPDRISRRAASSSSASARPASSPGSSSDAAAATVHRSPALVPADEDVDGGLTENRLRAVAARTYPEAVVALYGKATVAAGRDRAERPAPLLGTSVARGAGANPYDLAADDGRRTCRTRATSQYDDRRPTDMRLRRPLGRRVLRDRQARLLRVLRHDDGGRSCARPGIPARIVEGFLPGDRDPLTGDATVRNSDAHAWVEVYFPGYGWVDVRPDRRRHRRADAAAVRPAGRPASAPGRRRAPRQPADRRPRRRVDSEPGGGGPATISPDASRSGRSSSSALLLAVVVGRSRRSRPGGAARAARSAPTARTAWSPGWPRGSGFGPRPEPDRLRVRRRRWRRSCPTPGRELETVARAKVEVAVRRPHRSAATGCASLREAQRRLRTSLLRLVFRRRAGAPTPLAPRRGRAGPPRARRSGCVPPGPRRPPRRAAARGGPVRLCARRTGCPPRNSTTVIAHRSIVHIQNRSSGRSNRVSSETLNTPSWPTTIDHGWVGAASRRSPATWSPVARARARRPSASRPSRSGERRPDARRRPRRATRRRAPRPRSGGAARSPGRPP